jgi:hypothetical protein
MLRKSESEEMIGVVAQDAKSPRFHGRVATRAERRAIFKSIQPPIAAFNEMVTLEIFRRGASAAAPPVTREDFTGKRAIGSAFEHHGAELLEHYAEASTISA